jgi:hypothetical protein
MSQKQNFQSPSLQQAKLQQHRSQRSWAQWVLKAGCPSVLSAFLVVGLSSCGLFQRSSQPLPTDSSTASTELSPPSSSFSPTPSPTATNKPEFTLKLENQLKTVLTETLQTPVQAADCPIKPAAQAGDSFDCQVTAANQPFTVAVTITDANGQFQWQTKGLLQLNKLEQFIQTQVREKGGGEVTAECGDTIRSARVGETFDCQVTNAEGQKRSARVTVKDDKGSVDISLL